MALGTSATAPGAGVRLARPLGGRHRTRRRSRFTSAERRALALTRRALRTALFVRTGYCAGTTTTSVPSMPPSGLMNIDPRHDLLLPTSNWHSAGLWLARFTDVELRVVRGGTVKVSGPTSTFPFVSRSVMVTSAVLPPTLAATQVANPDRTNEPR